MKAYKKFMYMGLPVLGILFYLIYLHTAAIDMVYSDYIRLINSYLPDVWNPEKFFVADLLTRIPVNFLERGINVCLFGYSVTFDRVMGVLGFGLSALVIGWYCRKHQIGAGWYTAIMVVMFSLNKWEMLYNGTGWAHFLAFACFYYNYYVLDKIYEDKMKHPRRTRELLPLLLLPPVVTICVAGPYCAIYTMTLVLAYLFIWVRNQVLVRQAMKKMNVSKKDGPTAIFHSELCRLTGRHLALLAVFAVVPLLVYLWSNSQAVYEYSGAVEGSLVENLLKEPVFFIKFFLKSFASMVFGVELISRHMAGIPGKVWCLLGLLVLAAYFLALWMNFYYGIAEKTIFPLMFLAGGGMNHLMVLVSRWIFMSNDAYGMSSRYALQYQIGILGILMTFALAFQEMRRQTPVGKADQGPARESGNVPTGEPRSAAAAHGHTLIKILALSITAMFLIGNMMTTAEEFSFGKERKKHNLEVKEILLNFENESEDVLKASLEYRKPGTREALTILKENGWNIFREN